MSYKKAYTYVIDNQIKHFLKFNTLLKVMKVLLMTNKSVCFKLPYTKAFSNATIIKLK